MLASCTLSTRVRYNVSQLCGGAVQALISEIQLFRLAQNKVLPLAKRFLQPCSLQVADTAALSIGILGAWKHSSVTKLTCLRMYHRSRQAQAIKFYIHISGQAGPIGWQLLVSQQPQYNNLADKLRH